MKDIIFFDLDGTIINPSLRYHQIHKNMCNLIGCDFLNESNYWSCKRKKMSESNIMLKCGVSNIALDVYFRDRIANLESEEYLSFDSLYPNVTLFLEKIKKTHVLVIVTFRQNRHELINELKRLGVFKYFDKILNCDLDVKPKELGKVKEIQAWLKSKTCKGFFFGDTEVDLKTAEILGLKSIAVSFGIRERCFLDKNKPNYIIESWDASSWDKGLKQDLSLEDKDLGGGR